MTYTVTTVAGVADIPKAITDFAALRGWTTTADSVTNPVTGLKTTITTLNTDEVFLTPTGGPKSRTRMPWLNGSYQSPDISIPTRVHLFGNNSPYAAPDSEPFIACVVECGFNQYRHLYIGGLVKAGAYTDGDVVAANTFNPYHNEYLYHHHGNKLLFRAYTNVYGNEPGGVKVTHAGNPTYPWRTFKSAVDGSGNGRMTSMTGEEVFGGNGDGVNDGEVFHGHADYAAGQVLVPVNLYCPNGNDGVDYRIRPLGHVSGARLVDMKNLEPGQQITISSDAWRVFPELSKRVEKSAPFPGTAGTSTVPYYWPFETSYNYGLAYREN